MLPQIKYVVRLYPPSLLKHPNPAFHWGTPYEFGIGTEREARKLLKLLRVYKQHRRTIAQGSAVRRFKGGTRVEMDGIVFWSSMPNFILGEWLRSRGLTELVAVSVDKEPGSMTVSYRYEVK